jgi:hypothetical protein
MKPLSRQLSLPFRAPLTAAPRAQPQPAAAWRAFARPPRDLQAAPDPAAPFSLTARSMEASA